MSGDISDTQLAALQKLLSAGDEAKFYSWDAWKRGVRLEVLKLDDFECQLCKAQGKVRTSSAGSRLIVHHVKHLRDRPDLALSVYDPETGERQLLTVCKDCHESLHPDALRQWQAQCEPVTAERWD